jgi:hypothetical protein
MGNEGGDEGRQAAARSTGEFRMNLSFLNSTRRGRARRVVAPGAILAGAALLSLGISGAFASSITPGKYNGPVRYQGFVSSTEFVNFKVTSSRTKVKKLHLTPFVPNKCGSGGPPPKETSKTAKIKNGKFTGTVKEFTTSGALSAKATITGKFLNGGKVSGKVKTKLPAAPQCNATFKYTAKAHGH